MITRILPIEIFLDTDFKLRIRVNRDRSPVTGMGAEFFIAEGREVVIYVNLATGHITPDDPAGSFKIYIPEAELEVLDEDGLYTYGFNVSLDANQPGKRRRHQRGRVRVHPPFLNRVPRRVFIGSITRRPRTKVEILGASTVTIGSQARRPRTGISLTAWEILQVSVGSQTRRPQTGLGILAAGISAVNVGSQTRRARTALDISVTDTVALFDSATFDNAYFV
jgi:hypothetical protein